MILDEELRQRLDAVIQVIGTPLTGELLSVEDDDLTNYVIRLERWRALIELDAVVTFGTRVMNAKAFISWFQGRNAHLNGAQPATVFQLHGAELLLTALEAELAGVYA